MIFIFHFTRNAYGNGKYINKNHKKFLHLSIDRLSNYTIHCLLLKKKSLLKNIWRRRGSNPLLWEYTKTASSYCETVMLIFVVGHEKNFYLLNRYQVLNQNCFTRAYMEIELVSKNGVVAYRGGRDEEHQLISNNRAILFKLFYQDADKKNIIFLNSLITCRYYYLQRKKKKKKNRQLTHIE